MPHRGPNARHPIGNWTRWLLVTAALAVTLVGVMAVATGRYQLRPVLSGSMRPGLPVGGVVITERVPVSSLRVRDVVVFHRPDKPQELVVHRIVSLTPGPSGPAIKTQGDANNVPDPWQATLSGDTAYRAVFSVPLFGYVVVWAHSPTGRLLFVLSGLLLTIAAAVGGRLNRRRGQAPQEVDQAATTHPAVERVSVGADRSVPAHAVQG